MSNNQELLDKLEGIQGQNEISEQNITKLDNLLKDINVSGITSESAGFDELPDGYYLTNIDKAVFSVSKSSGELMVAIQSTITDDGVKIDVDENGNAEFKKVEHSKNRKMFLYYVLKDERAIKRFISDMLKFDDEDGNTLFSKEMLTNFNNIETCLMNLAGKNIYVQLDTRTNQAGQKNQWKSLISWNRAESLDLPM